MGSSAPAIRCLPNGLLDLEVTPEHLVPIVQRNATQSPLLRLPAEIRKKICEFALSDFEFFHDHLRCKCPGWGSPRDHICNACKIFSGERRNRVFMFVNDSPAPSYHLEPWCCDRIQPCKTSPFGLPSTCRQLYSETTTLPFKLGTFILSEGRSLLAFPRFLLLAQRAAVGTLCTCRAAMREMWLKYNNCQLVDIFPSLRRVWLYQGDNELIPKYLVSFFGDDVEVKGFTVKAVPFELGSLSTWKTVVC